LRHTYEETSFDGDPYKFAATLYRLVFGADFGEKIPLFLPIGEDALEKLQARLRKLNKVLEEATPWSADLKKGNDKIMARL
jgi:hypothetical protein